MDEQAVLADAEATLERFTDETGWDTDIDGVERPGLLEELRDVPKVGPLHLAIRLSIGALRNRFFR